MAISGVYKITCKSTGKVYVGKSTDIETRWRGHKSRLSRNIHANIYLQRAWNKYNKDNFEWTILEIIDVDRLIEAELKWFRITNCCDNKSGFNIHKNPDNPIQDNNRNNFGKYVYRERKKKIPKVPETRKKIQKIMSLENISTASKEQFYDYAKNNSHKLDDKEIIRLYIQDKRSCGDISMLDGRSESTIYKILIENKVTLRDKSQANKIISDKILIKLYNLGLSFSQIGILVGVNPTTISKRFTVIGFPTRSCCEAKSIAYTREEFNKYFYNKRFIKKIELIKD